MSVLFLWVCGCSQPFDDPDSGLDSAPGDSVVDTGESGDTHDSEDSADTAEEIPLPICINEFMPANVASVYDSTGAAADWVELHNPGAEAVDLTGWTVSDDPAEPDKQRLDGLLIGREDFIVLWASGDVTVGPDHLGFKLSDEGGAIGVYTPEGQGTVVTYGSVEPDFSVARVTDCCAGEDCLDFQFRGTPGYSNVAIVYETVPLIASASTWRYWTGLDVDPAWVSSGFDDSAWPSGPAPLGYGDTQTTVIPYGDDPENKWTTSWFRLGFEVTDADDMDTLTVGVMRDDGAVVYINGIEVLRDNMPEGQILSTTTASAATTSETGFYSYTLDAFPLVEGHNTIAVEVHQFTVNSSDLTMDLELSASRVVE